jgi:hypothetical protein
MPFYARLTKACGRQANVTFFVLSAESVATVTEHLRKQHIAIDAVHQIQAPLSILRGTPTLLIVGSDGIIQHAYVGKLNSAQEKEFLKLIQSGRG